MIARQAAIFLIVYESVNGKKYYSVFRFYSEIVPAMEVYVPIIEFIVNGEGKIDLDTARSICNERPIMGW